MEKVLSKTLCCLLIKGEKVKKHFVNVENNHKSHPFLAECQNRDKWLDDSYESSLMKILASLYQ